MWKNTKVLVTGGASFIGSHLVEQLVLRGARVRVVDDLSSGKKENLRQVVGKNRLEFVKGNLLHLAVAQKVVKNIDVIFHLAAIHGGRGFVDTYQAVCADNILLDVQLIRLAKEACVKKFVFASSGCVYPGYLQTDRTKKLFLSERAVGPPYEPDNMYGWAKLTTEKMLQAYASDYKLRSVSCRYFTVYGPRGKENHAVIALIARAFVHQDPFEVWGDGTQIRNWTYVSDIVRGTILSAEKISSGEAINLGTTERIRVRDAVEEVFRLTNFRPKIAYLRSYPTGPINRVCDNRKAKKHLGWSPAVKFRDGLRTTVDWYFSTHNVSDVKQRLPRLLFDRS